MYTFELFFLKTYRCFIPNEKRKLQTTVTLIFSNTCGSPRLHTIAYVPDLISKIAIVIKRAKHSAG